MARPAVARMRIGIIAPPWLSIPPKGYGGIELVLDALAHGLRCQGHDVVLFATGDSTTPVERDYRYQRAMTDQIGSIPIEVCHVDAAYDALADCDIIHDHTLAGLLLARRTPIPVVTTIHGPFEPPLTDLYRQMSARVPLIAISADQASRAPADLSTAAVIHHGLALDRYPFSPNGGDHLVALGRMHPCKGLDIAINAARAASVPLIIAAKCHEPAEQDYYHNVIRPLLGGDITYIGEADHETKIALLASARALLNPIQWAEPFGLVMIEALACGTPVIATPNGAAPEIVTHGATGYLASTIDSLSAAIGAIDQINRHLCRHHAEKHFSMQHMANCHTAFYHAAIRSQEHDQR